MLFVDQYHKIDREALRLYVLTQLTQIKQEAEQAFFSTKGETFFSELHNAVAQTPEKDQEACRRVERQVQGLPAFIETWIKTAVDSPERMEFFVQSKAAEIASGDTQRDYFWAMQIRHDQLVALVRVLTLLLEHVKRWLTMSPADVVEDGVFQGLIDYSVEDQVYLEAEKVAKERMKISLAK